MTTQLHISVEQADIDEGDSCPLSCPVALAVNRAIEESAWRGNYKARVCALYITLLNEASKPGKWLNSMRIYALPEEAKKWIRQFDASEHHNCKPITFTAELA